MQGNNFYLNINTAYDHVLTVEEDDNEIWHKMFGHYNLKSL